MFEPSDFAYAEEDSLYAPIEALSAAIGAVQLELLRQIATVPTEREWERWGARDGAHWLAMRMGLSYWKASRLIRAAMALHELPRLSKALGSGRLGLDKVLELARFAKPSDEAQLISWAQTKPPIVIRHEGERRARLMAEEVREIERNRSVSWSHHEGQFNLEAWLPAAQGATVAKALERMAETLPQMPGEEGPGGVEQRRADALVALCSGRLSADPDPDRATVVVHANLRDLKKDGANAEIESGGVMDPLAVSRLMCDARLQAILRDDAGNLLSVSPMRREPAPWLVRLVRMRDKTCRFPGCDARRYTQVHHIEFWSKGGRTEEENCLLLCFMHHRLVHEYGWVVRRSADGQIRWFWPDGRAHRPGDSPEDEERRERARRWAETAIRLGFKPVPEGQIPRGLIPGIGPGATRRPRTGRSARADRPSRSHTRPVAPVASPP